MDFAELKKLSEKNDVRIDDFRGHRRTPHHYYDSLRLAFGFFFNTFHTNNHSYDSYAQGLHGRNVRFLKRDFLDEENTVMTIVSFERFFELFIKDLLHQTHPKLILSSRNKDRATLQIVKHIQAKSFIPKMHEGNPFVIPFRATLNRFYDLLKYTKDPSILGSNRLVKKFSKMVSDYQFFDDKNHQSSLQLLNWYRDRILHKGNKLPSLWLLDYLVTQRFIPLIRNIITIEKSKLGESLFYLKTPSGIDILEKLEEIKFEFGDIKSKKKVQETYENLIRIGHLKELGRASLNMNIYVRNNWQASYEYNYKDPKGRGKRFAIAEKQGHPDAKEIKNCPCCGEESLVVYLLRVPNILPPHEDVKIYWVKCYTCDYHLRYNAEDPYLLQLYSEPLFI